MYCLIVKKDMRPKGFEHIPFGDSPQEKSLVNPHVPCPQGADHTLMGRGAPGRNQGCPKGRLLRTELFLNVGNGF